MQLASSSGASDGRPPPSTPPVLGLISSDRDQQAIGYIGRAAKFHRSPMNMALVGMGWLNGMRWYDF
ncbi:hypothetical protein JTE90_009944 [Oedothorax gibbosus]|uniref:Uncharacterized protein n=1 Tax=Oedothorax gibbosus TaxID=931172 RepID=A0AAV6UJE0_9ARAC|nr:hypothetical protein JTE90_009944 [Oedothorax gibbosus]